jgi:hypothetical protein
MWSVLASAITIEWWWLMVGVALMAGILRLRHVAFRPHTGLALTVVALVLVVCWIVVARELTA